MGRRLRFKGEFTNKVDTKGRVSVPASFRRVLQEGDPDYTEGLNPRLVVVYGNPAAKFLECYTIAAHGELEDRIALMPSGSKNRKMMERIYSTHSQEVTLDDTGRIVLTAKLREKIGVIGEAYFASNLDKFQIWNPETYEAEERAEVEEFFDEMPEDFDPMQLLDGAGV